MTWSALFFRAGALIALLIVIRYTLRLEGRRNGALLVAYLVVMGTLREWTVTRLSAAIDQPVPYTPDGTLGQIGGFNVVVVAGWVFTILLSFYLARLIQRRNFAGTNIFFTLALSALVTTAISYAVETCGTRIHLWTWRQPSPVEWLPFDWPFDAFEGWAATSLVILLVYCGLRYRLFAPQRWSSAAITGALVALFALADLAQPLIGPASPRKKVTVIYLVASIVLGFRAPRWMLGSSGEALERVKDDREEPRAAIAGSP